MESIFAMFFWVPIEVSLDCLYVFLGGVGLPEVWQRV